MSQNEVMDPNHTKIAVVMDRSGSMASVHEATVSGFNEFINGQKQTPGTADLMLVLFDDRYEVPYDKPISQVEPMTLAEFVPRGTTALNDAIGKTVTGIGSKLAQLPEAERPGQVIVVILTDGHENASKEFSREQVARMIEHQRSVYSWQFLFLGANQDAVLTGKQYSIQLRAPSLTPRSLRLWQVSCALPRR